MESSWFCPAPEDLLFKKDDPDDPRLGNLVKVKSLDNSERRLGSALKQKSFSLIGYPDDEGIGHNGGRLGSKTAPNEVRKVFYKMTPSLTGPLPSIFDFGNLVTENFTLEEKHHHVKIAVSKLLKSDYQIISVGGGHDFGYPDLAAFCEHSLSEGKRPFIINFDAHFDVRPNKDKSHSGTSFYKLLNEFEGKIDFYEIGIQDFCNSRVHLKWLTDKGAHVITLSEILSHPRGFEGVLQEKVILNISPENRLGLSVCMDVFSSAFSPGASAVYPTGLIPNEFLNPWIKLVEKFSPNFCGFYETSPPFDQDSRTSKLCALLMHQFIAANLRK
jgi:formiminoglutamase